MSGPADIEDRVSAGPSPLSWGREPSDAPAQDFKDREASLQFVEQQMILDDQSLIRCAHAGSCQEAAS